MPYFKDPTGSLHFIENEVGAALLPSGCVQIPTSRASAMIAEAERNRQAVYPHFIGNAKLDLFTREEQLAIVTATMSDPVVKLLYDRLLNAAHVTYENPETEYGLAILVAKGLLTPDRKAAIVAYMQPN